jgi:hypothetical protein
MNPRAAGAGGEKSLLSLIWLLRGQLAASGGGHVLVFRPGGVADGNVYVDETALAEATQEIQGVYTIVFDFSLVGFNYTVATVGLWDLAAGGMWTDEGYHYTLTFANETTLPSPPLIVDGHLWVSVAQSANVCTPGPSARGSAPFSGHARSVAGTGLTRFQGYSACFNNAPGQGGFIVPTGSYWIVQLDNYVGIQGSAGPSPVFFAGAGGIMEVDMLGFSYAQPFAVGNGAGSALIVVGSSPATYVTADMYPLFYSEGLYVDTIGGGPAAIPAFPNNRGYLLFSGGVFYQSNGAAWVAI